MLFVETFFHKDVGKGRLFVVTAIQYHCLLQFTLTSEIAISTWFRTVDRIPSTVLNRTVANSPDNKVTCEPFGPVDALKLRVYFCAILVELIQIDRTLAVDCALDSLISDWSKCHLFPVLSQLLDRSWLVESPWLFLIEDILRENGLSVPETANLCLVAILDVTSVDDSNLVRLLPKLVQFDGNHSNCSIVDKLSKLFSSFSSGTLASQLHGIDISVSSIFAFNCQFLVVCLPLLD